VHTTSRLEIEQLCLLHSESRIFRKVTYRVRQKLKEIRARDDILHLVLGYYLLLEDKLQRSTSTPLKSSIRRPVEKFGLVLVPGIPDFIIDTDTDILQGELQVRGEANFCRVDLVLSSEHPSSLGRDFLPLVHGYTE
jgi:hypothetical protein